MIIKSGIVSAPIPFLLAVDVFVLTTIGTLLISPINAQGNQNSIPQFIGVNMRGINTSIQHVAYQFPANYYEDSFRIISESGMNHIRYLLYWEAYEKDPISFMNELKTVAAIADKWGLKILYDNHQFHTSSWFDPFRGSGFPSSLFESNSSYTQDSGGSPEFPASKAWWTDWWNRTVKDVEGSDGWLLQAEFLKKIVNTVDNHPSTLGYEILNEPQVHSDDQWDKIGRYNTFMVQQLRSITDKTIAYSQHIPLSLNTETDISITADNMAKMAPVNKTNVIFKISLYGIPSSSTSYHGERLNISTKSAELAGVPLYVGEWNNVKRERIIIGDMEINVIDPEASDITQDKMNTFIQKFREINAWGWAYWIWNYVPSTIAPNYNLINITDNGMIQTTKYFDYLKNAVMD